MSSRSQRANKQRLVKQPSSIPQSGENSTDPLAAPYDKADRQQILETLENPLVLLILLLIGGFVGLMFFVPALLICEACILLALHGSKILNGRSTAAQATVYGIFFLATGSALIGLGIVARQPAREYFHEIASHSPAPEPIQSTPARPLANSIPPAGGFFSFPTAVPNVQTPPAGKNEEPEAPPAPITSGPEAALMQEMRARLSRDAGEPQKITDDVQWMRDQFAAGWAAEPPELASRHRAETEQTARLILANASNRNAIIQLIPHITIDAVNK